MNPGISANPMMSDFSISLASWANDGAALRAIRECVYIKEQHVPVELEWDGLDQDATHWLVTDKKDKPVATARLLANGHVGRMAVLAEYRGQGIGRLLIEAILATSQQRSLSTLFLNAQTSATGFYEKFGFIAEGDIFDDAGIPHRRMRLNLHDEH